MAPLGTSAVPVPVWQPASAETLAIYQQMLVANSMGGSTGGFSMAASTMPAYNTSAPWGASYGMNPNVVPATNTFVPGYASGNPVVYAHYAPAQAIAGQAQTTAGGTTTTPVTTTTPATTAAPAAAPPVVAKPEKKRTTAKAEPKTETRKAEPKAEPKPEPKKTVTVKSGDSLSKIAAAHGISWQKLYALNKGVVGGNPNLIRPGQVLKLP